MALPRQQIEKITSVPSTSAVAYQAQALVRQLKQINEIEYLPQACEIRDVLFCVVDYVGNRLTEIQETVDASAKVSPTVLARVQALGRVLHEIYSYIRFLWASSPRQCPPGIQVALTQLTKIHFPQENGKPVCLVRPQWRYNLTYIPMTLYLEQILNPSVLDPSATLGAKNPREMLKRLWELNPKGKSDSNPLPSQLAILSFAGLDTHDTLSYALLAHELGHFIDFSYNPPLNLNADLKQKATISTSDVSAALQKPGGQQPHPQDVIAERNRLVQRVFVAIREILADLLAVRMLGFAAFVAQSEFLKTLAPWPHAVITESGYPGTRFRLQVTFDHLVRRLPNNCLDFLRSEQETRPDIASPLTKFLEIWRDRLDASTPAPTPAPTQVQEQLANLVENAVRSALPELHQLAQRTIPDAQAGQLTERFFERVERISLDLPPYCPGDSAKCFAEIMSAGWAYQIVQGKASEASISDLPQRFDKYERTCRLVLKAVELQSDDPSTDSADPMSLDGFPKVSKDALQRGGVMGAPHIAARLQLDLRDPRRLDVTPLSTKAIQAASLDVRLGHWFAVTRRVHTPHEDLEIGRDSENPLGRELIFVRPGGSFTIHPGDLVLGVTLEFVSLPSDVMAFVEGRSRLGREGLIVATATQVAPGFHGVIVLEMANAGTVPLKLKPRMDVAQLVLQSLGELVPEDRLYKGKYYCQVHP